MSLTHPRRRTVALGLALLLAATLGRGSVAAAPAVTPSDPLYALHQQYLLDVHAPEAWDTQTGDGRIVVAVLDSGIDVAHPDLAANIWNNPRTDEFGCSGDLHGCNFVDPVATAAACGAGPALRTGGVEPATPRGTLLAGIIGAAGNNGLGIAGVAWQVGLMAVRVADCRSGADTTTVVNAMHYAADAGARIILINLESTRATASGCRPPDRFLADAVQYARDRGVLVVAGAGDDDAPCVADPAAVPGALAVGGYQPAGHQRWVGTRRGRGSNYGPQILVAAPADTIVGAIPRRPGQAPPDDLYAALSGTSPAAAIVAGVAALLLAQNSLLTPDWLMQLLAFGARPARDGNTPGWAGAGTLDIAAALRLTPAGFTGALTLAGAPAPDGTLVEAFVGDSACGQTASFTEGGRAGYALLVPAAAMQPGCGAPGATVELRVAGIAAAQAPWRPAATTLDLDLPALPPD